MKKLFKILFAILCMLDILFIYSSKSEQKLSLSNLNGGEEIEFGEPTLINWSSENIDGLFDILLWNGESKTYYLIASNISSSFTSYLWIPGNESLGNKNRIKIVCNDSIHIMDLSNSYFSVIEHPENTGPLNLKDKKYKNIINVYPNPAHQTLTISWEYSQCPQIIYVRDINGSLCKEIEVSNNLNLITIDVSGYSPGMYFVIINFNKNLILEKKVILY